MFDHVTLRVADREASLGFYTTVLDALGIPPTHVDAEFAEWDDFAIAAAVDGRPPTRGLHLGFVAPSREHVDAFWRAGTAAGYEDDGPPGPRPQYREDYYGGFLRDPDGNSAEAVHHGALRRGGVLDHLWIRVADLAASAAFYRAIAPHAGFRVDHERPDFVHLRGASGSFSLLPGEPTANLHLAFPGSRAAVDGFHTAATGAGHRDHGAPGERPGYHPGYYAAYVLDPDGHNVEVVDHGR